MHKSIKKDQSVCLLCFGKIEQGDSLLTWLFKNELVCYGCRKNMGGKWQSINILGMKINTFYDYEGYARDNILRFKDGKDKWIAPVFMYQSEMYLRIKYRGYLVVYVPSSDSAVKLRGYKHNRLLVKSVFSNVVDDYFIKVGDFKQSSMRLIERNKVGRSIIRNENVTLHSNKILLFDDIITTGNSLRVCYDILCDEGFEVEVIALYVVRS